jgi:SAM-dependent methyltransferase
MSDVMNQFKQRMKSMLFQKSSSGQAYLSSADKYASEHGYDANRYWASRLVAHRNSFRGVGNITLSEDENIAQYTSAVEVVASLLRIVGFNPAAKTVLDIGCGNGFWSGVFDQWKAMAYTGVDITDVMFEILRNRHPRFKFIAGDFLAAQLESGYDLISMIDVTQHITDDHRLIQILERIRSLLGPDGVFIVSFWDEVRESVNFYEVFRPFAFYTNALDGLAHTPPLRFRDKYISCFTSPQRKKDEALAEYLSQEQISSIANNILKGQ